MGKEKVGGVPGIRAKALSVKLNRSQTIKKLGEREGTRCKTDPFTGLKDSSLGEDSIEEAGSVSP